MSDSRKIKKTYIDKKPKSWKNNKGFQDGKDSEEWDWKKERDNSEEWDWEKKRNNR